jgi:CheY-like chemotaxis protein
MKSEGVLSGMEAVHCVKEKEQEDDSYYAVILDWKMPEMDGVETARAIRREVGRDVTIIILSAYDWSEIEQEARRAGVDAFVSKPLFKSRMLHVFQSLSESDEGETDDKTPLNNFEEMNLTGKRALLVEDNELNTEIAKEILQTTGMTVECAEDGSEAVDRIMEVEDGYYDIVFMDIQMPVMNGYEATRAIRAMGRKYTSTLPIIAMTANAFADDVRSATGAGMNEHISKPLDLKALAKILNKWVL